MIGDKTFQQSGKQDSFKQILNRLSDVYENSDSQFFRTITGIPSGPNISNESSMVMIALNKVEIRNTVKPV